jgi:hypothetical protein
MFFTFLSLTPKKGTKETAKGLWAEIFEKCEAFFKDF